MERIILILIALLASYGQILFAQSTAVGRQQAIPNISGDWNGPNDLILQFTYNPSSKKVSVDYCGIYRVVEWNPTARIENGYLILTQAKDEDGGAFNARLRIDSSNKMTGTVTMINGGETDFSGATTVTRSDIPFYSETPANNSDINAPIYPLLEDDSIGGEIHHNITPTYTGIGNWKVVYGKDRYGDEDKSNPMLACASKYGGVEFFITPKGGIVLYFPDTKFVPFNYDSNTLYIKTQNHEEIKIELTLLDKGWFHVPTQDDNFTLLDILDNGHFKVALEMSDISVGTKTLNAEVEKETLGVVNAMEHYFTDIPGFQDAWQFYGD